MALATNTTWPPTLQFFHYDSNFAKEGSSIEPTGSIFLWSAATIWWWPKNSYLARKLLPFTAL
jgi:hypothetical protein